MKKIILLSILLLIGITGSTVLANVPQRYLTTDMEETTKTSSLDFQQLAWGKPSAGRRESSSSSEESESGNVFGGTKRSKTNTGLSRFSSDFNEKIERSNRRREEKKRKDAEAREERKKKAKLAMLNGLNDEELKKRYERTIRIQEHMGDDFRRSVEEIEEWLSESQDAEEAALEHSFNMLMDAALGMKGINKIKDKKFRRIKKAIKDGSEIMGYDGNELVEVNLFDKEKDLIRARDKLEVVTKYISKLDPEFAGFAGECAGYITEAGRFALAVEQIGVIHDSLGDKLVAQKKVIALMNEFGAELDKRGVDKPRVVAEKPQGKTGGMEKVTTDVVVEMPQGPAPDAKNWGKW